MTALRNLLIALALLWAVPADAANRFWVPAPVTGVISGTGAVCRLTVPGTNGYVTGNTVAVTGVTGATGCNVTTTITVFDSTHIELDGSTFGGAYINGGLVAGGNYTGTNTANWASTTGSTTVGLSVPGVADVVTLDAGSCAAASSIVIGVDISVQTFVWGAYNCTVDNSTNHNLTVSSASGFSGSGTGTRTWIGGSGTYTVTAATTGTPWAMNVVTNLSNPTTAFSSATIAFTGNSTGVLTFQGGGLTYGTITFAGMSNKGGISIGGANTISSLTVTGPNTVVWPAVTNTITTLAFNGTIANPIGILDVSNTLTTAVISVASGTPTLAGVAVRGMTFQGGATWSATNCYDLGLNTGLTCAAPTSGGGKIIGG